MLNNIIFQGRLTRDPELKITDSGISITRFTVAVDRDYRNGDEKQTDFIDCVAFRGTADFIHRYFTKGRMIIVNGQLYSRKWQDRNGANRVSWEVTAQNVYFGDSKTQTNPAPAEPQLTAADDDEELPF